MQYIKGPLLILGRAGTGKTSLLAHKITWLIREYDAEASRILVLAAGANTVRALRTQVEKYLGRKLPALSILCLDELGLRIVQERLDVLGLQPGFSLYDRDERATTIRRLLSDIEPRVVALAGAVAEQVGRWKRALALPAAGTNATEATPGAVAARVYRLYEQRLRSANALDLDDLVRKAVRLLTVDAALLTQWRSRISFLLVDEYEHADVAEYELVRLLAGDGIPLTIAGDDTGAVQGRDAKPSDVFARLSTGFKDLRTVRLEENLRSSDRLVVAANCVAGVTGALSDAPRIAGYPDGKPVRVLHSRNEQLEAENIAGAVAAHQSRHGIDFSNYAILFRYPEQAPPLERALRSQRVPYRELGTPSFFEQPETRDLWSYLRLFANPADDAAFERVLNTPRRDIDRNTLHRLNRLSAEHGRPLLESVRDPEFLDALPPLQAQTLRALAYLLQRMIEYSVNADAAKVARELVVELAYADWLRDTCNDAKIAARRMDNVTRTINMLQRFARQRRDRTLRSIVTPLQLHALLYGGDELAGDGVSLVTFDAACGNEFMHVYIVGFEEGILPATDADGDTNLASERLIAYRALSRARESVTLTVAEQRRLSGGVSARRASRFLNDIPDQHLERNCVEPGHALAENTLANSVTYIEPGHYRPR